METYKLAVGELPSHSHEIVINTLAIRGQMGQLLTNAPNGSYPATSGIVSTTRLLNNVSLGSGHLSADYQFIADHSHAAVIGNTGSSQPHNNFQPYLVVYIWKRVS